MKIRPLTLEEIQHRREAAKERLKQRLEQKENCVAVTQNIETTKILDQRKEIIEKELIPEKEEYFIAFARVFSGKLKEGQSLYVLGPKHDPVSLFTDEVILTKIVII